MPRKRCALLTCGDLKGFFIDDELLPPAFLRHGWEAEAVVWDELAIDWRRYERAVVRTTWDYTRNLPRFLEALRGIEKAGVRLFNPYAVLSWNARKTYLLELEKKGVPIVPTRISRGVDLQALDDAFETFAAASVVVKPTVSASAHKTFVVERRRLDELLPLLQEQLRDAEIMVQPFLKEIQTQGEDSLFFFNGVFSHAVRKVPKSGDFRVQEEHGGSVTPLRPAMDLLRLSEKILAAVGAPLLYARVDLARDASRRPLLMELELIEPALYLRTDPGAAAAFVDAFAIV